jgi:hypothetical protein
MLTGTKIDLDNFEKRKFLTLLGLELQFLGRQPIASHYTDLAIPAPMDTRDTIFNAV